MVDTDHCSDKLLSMRVTSLKGFIPTLAKLVGVTPAALYERQRALARVGLLKMKSGRGPGSGVRLTAESVAMLLIALLATDSLSETEERVRIFAKLRSARCPLTGANAFADALSAILASSDLSKRVRSISVTRTGPTAEIYYTGISGSREVSAGSSFGTPRERELAGVVVGGQIREATLNAIIGALSKHLGESK
jgi:hypothetical protein